METVTQFVQRTQGPAVPFVPDWYPWVYAHHYLRLEAGQLPPELGHGGTTLTAGEAREVIQLWCALSGEGIEPAAEQLADAYLRRWGLGRSDPVLLGVEDDAKNRQMEHIMSRVAELVDKLGTKLEPDIERDLRVICYGWLAFTFETCRQRIIDPSTNADRLADSCAHALFDAIARVPEIPDELSHAMATARLEPR